MEQSLSIDVKHPWQWLLASVITVNMAFFNLSTLFGCVMRLVRGPYTFLSAVDIMLGFAILVMASFTTHWTLVRSARAIRGYSLLVLLLAAQMILYPQLPYATMIVFMEVAFACTGLVLYVVPLLLLVRVRQVLAS